MQIFHYLCTLFCDYETILYSSWINSRRACHDWYFRARTAYHAISAIGFMVFLSQFASPPCVVITIFLGQVYPRIHRERRSHNAQAHHYYSADGYDGGYFYYFLYRRTHHPYHCVGSRPDWLYRSGFCSPQSQRVSVAFGN